MAQKLNSQYGFSYDNLKVLLGGWNSWKQSSATDPAAYPIESSPLGAPATPNTPATPATPATPGSGAGNPEVAIDAQGSGSPGTAPATGDTGSTAGQTPGAAGTPLP